MSIINTIFRRTKVSQIETLYMKKGERIFDDTCILWDRFNPPQAGSLVLLDIGDRVTVNAQVVEFYPRPVYRGKSQRYDIKVKIL